MSGKMDGAEDAIMLAAEIVDTGALSIVNVIGNIIGKEMLSKLQEIMRSKPSLISLCGIADDATEVDLSDLGMDADDAVILASELPDKRAMTSLNLSRNRLGAEGAKHVADGIKVSKCVVAVVLAPFSCPSGHWLNCCCLLLSTG
jgi:Ran GTPase-activating protein (RanGAP) involved in mRNA processing and transport